MFVAPWAVRAEIGDPIRGLSAAELDRFTEGRTAFEAAEEADEGLGPIFNGTSCVQCHSVGATGGGSETVETRFGTRTRAGAFDPLASSGGSLIQTDGIGVAGACTFVGEKVPRAATIVAGRRTTPLFGLGLVDAVPDAAFVALAARESRFTPATAGRPNMVTDLTTGRTAVGKFGWKGQVPNLLQFSADAYLNEMGITTPLFPDESCPQGNCALLACDPMPGVDDDMEDVELFHDFMRMLAPPSRTRVPFPGAIAVQQGSRVFDEIGCSDCHVTALRSGADATAGLRFQSFQPFSDFLLHDMGSLGDGIEQGRASGREMRTAPLWGLRMLTTFLHDGRAHTIDDAIRAHEGQGRAARNRYAALSPFQRARLITFLGSL